MAYKLVPEKCSVVTCADCEHICPNKAINTTVDPEKCTECVGTFAVPRCVEVCPMGAFVLDPEHQETKEQLLKKWDRLHPGRKPRAGTY